MNNVNHPRFSGAGILCATLALGLALPTVAQDSLQVTFVGDRELYLREVDKPTDSPRAVDLGIERPIIEYTPISKRTAPATAPRSIAPIAVKMDAPLPRLYAGHARAGFGLYASPLLEVHLGDTRSRQGSWGLSFRHLSSTGSTGKDSVGVDEGWSKNAVNGYLRRFVKRSSITASVFLERDAWGLHGLDLTPATEGLFSPPINRQNYGKMGAALRLQNHERDSSKVHRNIALSYSHLSVGIAPTPGGIPQPDILKSPGRENLVEVTGKLHTHKDGARYDLEFETHLTGSQLEAIGDTTAATVNRSAALVGVRPSVTKERGAYMVKAGAGLWVDARGTQSFHFYPMAEVRFRLLDDVFVPYGGVDGGMQRNAVHDLIDQNPFFDARYNAGGTAMRGALTNTNRALELYGGLRGKLTRDLAFNAQARTTRFREFQYWVNEAGLDSAGQRFSAAYDSLTVASVIGEATYRGQGPLELSARAEFHTYGTGGQPHAWYQPRTRFSASGKWNLEELLFLELGLEIVGARYAPSRVPFAQILGGESEVQSAGEEVGPVMDGPDPIFARKLPAYTAIDLGVEYRYNARLSLGLEARGPLGSTEIFNGYGAQRMGIMMLASYRF